MIGGGGGTMTAQGAVVCAALGVVGYLATEAALEAAASWRRRSRQVATS